MDSEGGAEAGADLPVRAPVERPSPAGAAHPDGGGAQDRVLAVASTTGAVVIADLLGMQASTVHAVLVRCKLDRLSHLDRITGERIRRYEHEHPGDLIHVDVKQLGKVPDGGGWRYLGRQVGGRNRSATAARTGAAKSKFRPHPDRHLLPAHRDRCSLPRRLRRGP